MSTGIGLTPRHPRPGRGSTHSRVLAVLGLAGVLLVSACTPKGGDTPPSGSVGSSSPGSSSTAVPASLVLVQSGVTIVKGVPLPAMCDGKPTPVQVIKTKQESVPAGTTGVVPGEYRFTVCPPETYQPKNPANIAAVAAAKATPVKVRVFLTNSAKDSQMPSVLTQYLNSSFTNSWLENEPGLLSSSFPVVYPGESATWEIALALPAGGAVMKPFTAVGDNPNPFELPMPVPGAPAQVQPTLPAATPPVKPSTLPALEPGMALNEYWAGVVAADVPHTCGGKATGKVTPIPLGAKTATIMTPGDSYLYDDAYRVTLCPGVPYQPSPQAIPQGDYEYRLFTAYRTKMAGRLDRDASWFFPSVAFESGDAVPSPAGRVLDPAVVPYFDRTRIYEGRVNTVMWTFVVAFPKTGGPYLLRSTIEGGVWWSLT